MHDEERKVYPKTVCNSVDVCFLLVYFYAEKTGTFTGSHSRLLDILGI